MDIVKASVGGRVEMVIEQIPTPEAPSSRHVPGQPL